MWRGLSLYLDQKPEALLQSLILIGRTLGTASDKKVGLWNLKSWALDNNALLFIGYGIPGGLLKQK